MNNMNMANMRTFTYISFILFLVSHVAYSRSMQEDPNLVSNGADSGQNEPASFLEWPFGPFETETCEPIYGFLPCSSNVWGLLFMIVVYEILISIGGQYIGTGSNLLFEIIGPGVFGASMFQLLGVIPQIVLLLASSFSASAETASERAKFGMGLVAGATVMLLTLIWGSAVIRGSYDLSVANTTDTSGNQKKTLTGLGVVTDVETSYTARIMLISLVPFIFLWISNFFGVSGRRVMILLTLIITVVLLFAYISYQTFQPWVQNRRFEYLMNKYAKDKLLKLFTRNGQPDTQKIQQLFKQIDRNNNGSVSAAELRVLFLGVNMNEDDLSTDRDVEQILASFDTSGDAGITQDEFVRGITRLVSDLSSNTTFSIKKTGNSSSQNNDQVQQPLLGNNATTSTPQRATNSWRNYLTVAFYLIIGAVILTILAEPLTTNVNLFAQAANLPSFAVSYLAIPFALNYGVAVQSFTNATQKTQNSISLTLSALYGGVYMNNIIGLILFLALVYARNVWADVSTEIIVVLIICIFMTVLTSICTTYSRWMGYLVVLLYPISLVVIYVFTSIL